MIIGISGKIGSGKDTVGLIIQYLTSKKSMGLTTLNSEKEFNEFKNYKGVQTDWQIKKFGGKLKEIVSILTRIAVEDLEKPSIKEMQLSSEWDYFTTTNPKTNSVIPIRYATIEEAIEAIRNSDYVWKKENVHNFTVRRLLQEVGTDAMRNVIHPNIWVNALFSDYRVLDDTNRAWNGTVLDYEKCIFPNWVITDVRFPNEANAIKEREGVLIRISRANKMTKEEVLKEIRVTKSKQHVSETALDNYTGFKYLINNDNDMGTLIKNVKQILLSENIL